MADERSPSSTTGYSRHDQNWTAENEDSIGGRKHNRIAHRHGAAVRRGEGQIEEALHDALANSHVGHIAVAVLRDRDRAIAVDDEVDRDAPGQRRIGAKAALVAIAEA